MSLNRRSSALLLAALLLALVSLPQAQDATARRGFSVTITEPVNQGVVFGKTRIAAEVKVDEPDLVDRVEFMVGDDVVFIDREPPYECQHDFGEESKSWIIRAVAFHKENVQVTDAVITRKMAFTMFERVSRVVLWLSATDKRGNFLTELNRDAFSVFEDDIEQNVEDFFREDRPITLALLIDSSGSMKGKLKQVRAAAHAFVDTLREQDQALLIDFDDKVFLVEDLTSDKETLKDAITSVEAIGGTALYDVLHAAYRKIGKIEGRKAIILLSDGDDTASQFGHNRVLEEAMANNTLIYAIGLGGDGAGPRKSVLKEFSDVTGGRAYFVKKADELIDVYRKIAEELRTQYYMAYETSNEVWDGRWIKIRVESAKEDVKVRARRGYFAVRKPKG